LFSNLTQQQRRPRIASAATRAAAFSEAFEKRDVGSAPIRDHAVGRSLATDDRPQAGFLHPHTKSVRGVHEENCQQLQNSGSEACDQQLLLEEEFFGRSL